MVRRVGWMHACIAIVVGSLAVVGFGECVIGKVERWHEGIS